MLHVGTLAAVLVVYREAIGKLAIGGISTLADTQLWRKPRGGIQRINRTQVYLSDLARFHSDRYYRGPVQDGVRIFLR